MRQKGILIILIINIFIFFTACGEQKIKPADINYCFDCTADITCNGEKIKCTFIRKASSRVSIQILSPEFCDLTYYWSGKDFTISYSGLSAKYNDSVLPKTSFPLQIIEVINYAEKNKDSAEIQENKILGNINGFDFVITAEPDTGLIKSISIPKKNITAELYNYI